MKNIEDLKKRLWSRMRNYTDDKKLLKRYMNDLNLIQTEYDKSIKEMILKWLNANTKGLSVKTREEFIFSYNDILEIIDELILSKIGDNSEVEK